MGIYRWFTYWKGRFSIAMLNYQRVHGELATRNGGFPAPESEVYIAVGQCGGELGIPGLAVKTHGRADRMQPPK